MEPAVVGSLVELRGVSDLESRVYFGEEKAWGTYDSSVSDLESWPRERRSGEGDSRLKW